MEKVEYGIQYRANKKYPNCLIKYPNDDIPYNERQSLIRMGYIDGAIEQKQIDDDARTMQLSDYTTEELKVELKRRADVIKAEHEKVKRCRHCKHLLCKNHRGEEVERDSNNIFGCQCKVTTSKVKPHKLKWVNKSQKACDKFEEI